MNFKNKNVLIYAGLAVFLGLAVFFGIMPLINAIKNRSEEFIEARKSLKFIQEKSGKVDSIKKTYESIQQDAAKIFRMLIDPRNPIETIKLWEQIAKEHNLDIDISFSPSEKQESDIWPSLLFQLKATGNFNDFMRFFSKLESSLNVIKITSISIAKSPGKTPGQVSADLGLKVFLK